ncbi:MAG: restriction endonuclease subunit S, partial [Clostridia bacterium]|nr:restriction endonuclease subunit S [Clostridia bacterium]
NCHYEKVGKEIVCIDEEVADFDIPDSWCLCRMSTIANIYTGNSINETEKQRKYVGLPDGYNYIATKDVSFEHSINYENGVKIPFCENNFRIAYKHTPLLCIEGGSAGRKIAILEQDVCFGNKLCAFQSLGVNPKYLYYYLQNPLFIQIFKSKTTGIIGGVSVNTLKTLIFALPPLSEQARIVEEIERFEPLLVEYDRLEQQKTKLDGEIYDKLKKSILQYAIQGKLVEQDENDEPASVLLERIRAEKKAQLGKKYVESYIYKGDDNCYYEHIGGKDVNITEEIPYDLPSGWVWSRLDDLALYKKGPFGSSLTKDMFVPKSATSIKVYEQKNAIYKNCLLGEYFISESKYETMKSFEVFPKDIIVSCAGTIGETYVLPDEAPKGIINQALMKIKLFNQNIVDFYLIYFDYILKGQAQKSSKGSAIKNIPPFDILKKMLMPIPPLKEQERIVNKINEIFAKL